MSKSGKIVSILGGAIIGNKILNKNTLNKGFENVNIETCAQICDSKGNMGIGEGACYLMDKNKDKNLIGSNNTATGSYSLNMNNYGKDNTAIVSYSLKNNRDGCYNTATVYQSLTNNIKGNYNTSDGYNSLKKNENGTKNTAIGSSSSAFNRNGNNNTSIGANSLVFNVNGNNNTSIGVGSLYNNINGNNNISIGYASSMNSTGSNNIIIGNLSKEDDNNIIKLGRSNLEIVKLHGNKTIELPAHKKTYLVGPIHICFSDENKSVIVIDNDEFDQPIIKQDIYQKEMPGNNIKSIESKLRFEVELLKNKIQDLEKLIEINKCKCKNNL